MTAAVTDKKDAGAAAVASSRVTARSSTSSSRVAPFRSCSAHHADIEFPEMAKTLTLGVAQHLGDNGPHDFHAADRWSGSRHRGHRHRCFDLRPRPATASGPRVQRSRSLPRRAWLRRAFREVVIHRNPPAFDQLEGRTEMLETGLKVVDLLTPYVRGGKIGLFGGAGVGKTVLIQEMIAASPRTSPERPCSSVSAPVRATTLWVELADANVLKDTALVFGQMDEAARHAYARRALGHHGRVLPR